MLDHVSVPVTSFEKSAAFYDLALAPLGITRLMTFPGDKHDSAAGWGADGKLFFLVGEAASAVSTHVAFAAKDRGAVVEFYQAALSAGGQDNGGPGLREQYHPNYYAAFVLDPDGHNIEAVCHIGE